MKKFDIGQCNLQKCTNDVSKLPPPYESLCDPSLNSSPISPWCSLKSNILKPASENCRLVCVTFYQTPESKWAQNCIFKKSDKHENYCFIKEDNLQTIT